ncbi:hypothetical protein AYO22_06621 [Fonsecaea multimorphosa]|nr:hypothetical protein AYO22_06621 [Fonsecaea multimorphosa]
MSRAIDGDGDHEMAEPAAAESSHNRRRRCQIHISRHERLTLEAHIDSIGGRTYLDEQQWTMPDGHLCPLLRLPPITPGNPYFFHEQVTASGGTLPEPRREALPPLGTLVFDWDTEEAEDFADQRRRDRALASERLRAQEHLQQGHHANVPAGYPVHYPETPPSVRPKECAVCFEEHQPGELVVLHHCQCAYCLPCLNQAFRIGCKDRASFPPKCHKVPLRISALGSVLEPDVVERYKQIEAEFGAHRPFYCALLKCSAFIPETDHLPQQEVASDHTVWDIDVKKRTCPAEEEDVIKLYELGNEKEWRQCPTCGNMVEKTEGCEHMDCVCGVEFCYVCGALFDENSRCGCNDEDDEHDNQEDDEDEWNLDGFLAAERWPGAAAAFGPPSYPLCFHGATFPVAPDRWHEVVRRAYYAEYGGTPAYAELFRRGPARQPGA